MGIVSEQLPRQQPGEEPQQGSSPDPTQAQHPDQLDPEQLRQFQQFQQFQEFLRFNEATQQRGAEPATTNRELVHTTPTGVAQHQSWAQRPPNEQGEPPRGHPRPSLPKVPRWLKKLGGKLLSAFLVVVALVIAATWAYNHFFGSDDDGTTESVVASGGGTYRTNQILSTKPYEAVREVYDAIAQNLVPQACGRFEEAQQQKFAEDMGFPDCQAAVAALHGQVTSVNDYAESLPSYTSKPVEGDQLTVDSCQFPVEGGPALGIFTVSKVEKGQWLITGHEPGQQPCPAPNPAPDGSAPNEQPFGG